MAELESTSRDTPAWGFLCVPRAGRITRMGKVDQRRLIDLTDRQREVILLIAAGCSNVEVAQRLGITARTAKAHSDSIRRKLGVSRRRHIPAAFRVLTGEDPLADVVRQLPARGA